MKVHDVTQRSAAWLQLRQGIPTCSQYNRIITDKSMKRSGQAEAYMAELIAERLTGKPVREVSTAAMVAGEDREIDAFRWYEFHHDVDLERFGFVKHDTLNTGGSPDGGVHPDGLVEIKCPLLHTHIKNVATGEIAPPSQVQGYLWLTDREWCDTISYPEEDLGAFPHVVHVKRDPAWMEALGEHLTWFCGELDKLYRRVRGETLEDQLKASAVWLKIAAMEQAGTLPEGVAAEARALIQGGQYAMARALIADIEEAA